MSEEVKYQFNIGEKIYWMENDGVKSGIIQSRKYPYYDFENGVSRLEGGIFHSEGECLYIHQMIDNMLDKAYRHFAK